jgi:hypothetical protein
MNNHPSPGGPGVPSSPDQPPPFPGPPGEGDPFEARTRYGRTHREVTAVLAHRGEMLGQVAAAFKQAQAAKARKAAGQTSMFDEDPSAD